MEQPEEPADDGSASLEFNYLVETAQIEGSLRKTSFSNREKKNSELSLEFPRSVSPKSSHISGFSNLSPSDSESFKLQLDSQKQRHFVYGKDAKLFFKLPDVTYANNRIVTSKYTIWNFLPKNLFEQFRRAANFYMLIICIIQFLVETPVTPYASLFPLAFIIFSTGLRQAYEDWIRHQADIDINKRISRKVKNGRLVPVKVKNIKVGDIICVKEREEFPCDLIFLSSSNPNGGCSVTTTNLDGETNLKMYHCVQQTRRFNSPDKISKLNFLVECDLPSPDLYKFSGRITFLRNTDKFMVPLHEKNLLLRGASLQNTTYIFGIAAYTGNNTKVIQNSKIVSNKFSSVERRLNLYLYGYITFLVIEVLVSVYLSYYFDAIAKEFHWYIPPGALKGFDLFTYKFFSFLVLYFYVIPFSLYFTLELDRFIGSDFFQWDLDLSNGDGEIQAICTASDLIEELGQVQFLFTDKTGTLTKNVMKLKRCSINGVKYKNVLGGDLSPPYGRKRLSQPLRSFLYLEEIESFLLALAVCNTVRTNVEFYKTLTEEEKVEKLQEIKYYAASSDELAIVEGCRSFGVILVEFNNNIYRIRYTDQEYEFELLELLEFGFGRKCMSVIVRNPKDEIFLICKGADSVILDKCTEGPLLATTRHCDAFASEGLRTLAIAERRLTEQEYHIIRESLYQTKLDFKTRDEKLQEIYKYIEQDLKILGVVGIEDKLQDYVPETVSALQEAGIKIWVLTGDKPETVLTICHSCGLLKDGMEVVEILNVTSVADCKNSVINIQLRMARHRDVEFSLLTDGISLATVFENTTLKKLFRKVVLRCETVICSRMSPLQKAMVVKLIKFGKVRYITAAIGDGANDCSMIQEADVGLAIIGHEGRQAVNASDFAIPQFHHLRKTFLVHGHYYYIRVAVIIQYFFYKNLAFITVQLYLQLFSMFSSQTIYESIYLMLFNLTFTSVPIVVYGLLEQDYPAEMLMAHPCLYRSIANNCFLSFRHFILWFSLGIWHSLVFYFGVYFLTADGSIVLTGQISGLMEFGSMILFVAVFIVHIKLALNTRFWAVHPVCALVLSLMFCFAFMFLYNMIDWREISHLIEADGAVFNIFIKSWSYWLIFMLLLIMALIPDFLVLTGYQYYMRDYIEKEALQSKLLQRKRSKDFDWTLK